MLTRLFTCFRPQRKEDVDKERFCFPSCHGRRRRPRGQASLCPREKYGPESDNAAPPTRREDSGLGLVVAHQHLKQSASPSPAKLMFLITPRSVSSVQPAPQPTAASSPPARRFHGQSPVPILPATRSQPPSHQFPSSQSPVPILPVTHSHPPSHQFPSSIPQSRLPTALVSAP